MQHRIAEWATKYGFSEEAVQVMLRAMQTTGGKSAQFNHPELGGMGQWMPGMVMTGDMFNTALQARITNLCTEMSTVLADLPTEVMKRPVWADYESWLPAELGPPDTRGGQNDMHYAYFARHHRLWVKRGATITTYDTTGYQITGVMQQQAGGISTVIFTGPHGALPVDKLKIVR